ncbi:MAG: sucrase ferredoxin [Kineosporiaceae bacterium]|nr:sucrase ferredoxin [Kineosporiaceae bacterium]
MTPPATLPSRCALAARARQDPLVATAPPAQRLLLIELNGPWGRDALRESRMDRYHAGRLADRAHAAGIRVQLIRRPGRHSAPAQGPTRDGLGGAVAVADVRAGVAAVQWQQWGEARELLDLDLRAPVSPSGPQEVALVCTHGRHDLCCAIDGRPVAASLAARGDWDVWETSHLSGDRFAANLLLLPTGDLFGRLDPTSAAGVVDAFRVGELVLGHHRGRFGRPVIEQAAAHHAMVVLGLSRREAVTVLGTHRLGEHRWAVDVRAVSPGTPGPEHGPTHSVAMSTRWSAPDRLTCGGASQARVRLVDLESVTPLA